MLPARRPGQGGRGRCPRRSTRRSTPRPSSTATSSTTTRSPTRSRLRYSDHVYQPLDVAAMNRRRQALKGRHDFHSFETHWPNRTSSVRTITHIAVNRMNDFVWIDVEADGFLYNMVRTITGTLVLVGTGPLARGAGRRGPRRRGPRRGRVRPHRRRGCSWSGSTTRPVGTTRRAGGSRPTSAGLAGMARPEPAASAGSTATLVDGVGRHLDLPRAEQRRELRLQFLALQGHAGGVEGRESPLGRGPGVEFVGIDERDQRARGIGSEPSRATVSSTCLSASSTPPADDHDDIRARPGTTQPRR